MINMSFPFNVDIVNLILKDVDTVSRAEIYATWHEGSYLLISCFIFILLCKINRQSILCLDC